MKSDIYQIHLNKMYDLHGSGEGAVLSYMKRNMLSFEGVEENKGLFVKLFCELGFDRVLKEMGDRGFDFRVIKEEDGSSLTVLDAYLKQARWYDPDCLKVIIDAGKYNKEDIARSFIKVCDLHKESLQNKTKEINCLNLDVVLDVALKEGMDLSSLVEGRVPFYALCDVYDFIKHKKMTVSPSYQKMLVSCIQKGLDLDVDLNVVDDNNRTGFSFSSMELKAKFVRYQSIKDDERLLDLFMIVDQLANGQVEKASTQKIAKHIKQLQKDIFNARKRMRFE